MKIKVSKKWCQRSAEIEGESSVGAGAIGLLMAVPSDALLACPFCGSKAEITVWQDGGTMVHCSNAGDCWATIGPLHPNDSTKREARRLKAMVTAQWNRRPANVAPSRPESL